MNDAQFESLTQAERGVLRAALGRTNEQIGTLLGISVNTVAAHMLAARRKLGSPPRGDAARAFYAWEASNQNSPSPSSVIGFEHGSLEPLGTGDDVLHENRTPFVFVDANEPATSQHDAAGSVFESNRIMMILVGVTLLLAAIRFLPDLVERARELGDVIVPLLDRAGVPRSG